MGKMSDVTVYLKCERNIEVQSPDVFLSDVGAVRCQDAALAARLKAIKVYRFAQNDARRCVISVLKLVELMEKECQNISVQVLGETDVLLEWVNDVGINDVFTLIYSMVMNREPQGLNILEVSYTIGLAAGIIVFFNHVGGRRLTKDPTPIEVSIRNYEEEVDKALIAQAGREGKEKEAN